MPPAPPESPRRHGTSVWLALPIGAIAGAVAAAAVSYGLAIQETSSENTALTEALARIATLESRQTVNSDTLGAVSQRLDKLEAADTGAQLAELHTSQDTLQKSQDALQASVQAATTAATAAGQQAEALGTRIDGVQKHIDEVASAATAFDQSVARVAVLGSIRSAILTGRPFAPELEAARAMLGPAANTLDPLAPYAAEGFPPPAVLAQKLSDAARAARPASAPPAQADGSTSLFGRLLSNAESLVTVQSADAPVDSGVQKTIDEAAAAVLAGDFDRAGTQLEALPAPVKTQLGADLAAVLARRDALSAATSLYQQALAAISGKAP